MKTILSTILALSIFTGTAFADGTKTYDRVMESGTLRCGYYLFKPMSWINTETGKLEGLAIELWDILAKNMNLKVEWAEEVTFGNMYEGLRAGRYDAICTPTWPNAQAARAAEFSIPLFYSSINAYVRADETRLTAKNWQNALNSPDFIISAQDGSVDQHIADSRFPEAKLNSLPQGADGTQVELNVMLKKADIAFIDGNRAAQFLAKNPGTLKRINEEPLQIFPFEMAVEGGELRFKAYLDVAVQEVLNNGEMDRLLDKYEPAEGRFPRVLKAYSEK